MKKAKLLYIGRRIMRDGETINYAFLHKGRTVYFRKVRAVLIGHHYEGFTPKSGLQLASYPKDLGRSDASADQLTVWQNADTIAFQEQRRKAVARKLARNPQIIEACNRLRPLVAKLRYSEKRALVDYIVDELEREERERSNAAFNIKINKMLARVKQSSAKVEPIHKKARMKK